MGKVCASGDKVHVQKAAQGQQFPKGPYFGQKWWSIACVIFDKYSVHTKVWKMVVLSKDLKKERKKEKESI